MSYLLVQIFLCLLVAGLIGAFIGWWLRGGCRDELAELESKWSTKYDADKAVWKGKVDVAETHIKQSISNNNDEWDLKLREAESNWEGKVQGLVGNYDLELQRVNLQKQELEDTLTIVQNENKDKELDRGVESQAGDHDQKLIAAQDELAATRAEVKDLQQKLADVDNEWNLKLNHVERGWETKLQGVMSASNSAQQALKSDLNAVQETADDAKNELLRTDQEFFATVGNLDECYDVEEIEGIGPGYGKKFKSMGVHTTCDFSDRFLHNQDAAKKAAVETNIDLSAIQAWASMADLTKLPGADGQYAEIMQVVGVSSREELSAFNPKKLHDTMAEYNDKHAIVPEVPSIELISKWIKLEGNSTIVTALDMTAMTEDMHECYEIEEIEGIGLAYGKKLRSMGINTTCDLAKSCLRDNRATKKVSKKTQINFDTIRAWASMADLMRLPGVDGQFAEMMQTVGVSSRKELIGVHVNALQNKMVEFNAKNKIVPEVPTKDMLVAWVEEAKKH